MCCTIFIIIIANNYKHKLKKFAFLIHNERNERRKSEKKSWSGGANKKQAI